MSAVRLSEPLPGKPSCQEFARSHAGQRLSGYLSDRLVSNNFSGNATHILFSSVQILRMECKRSFHPVGTSRNNSQFRLNLKILPKNELFPPPSVPLLLFQLLSLDKLSLCPAFPHSTLPPSQPHAILFVVLITLQSWPLRFGPPRSSRCKPPLGRGPTGRTPHC